MKSKNKTRYKKQVSYKLRDSTSIDKLHQVWSIKANFIHSQDAGSLMYVVDKMRSEGELLYTVHDMFGINPKSYELVLKYYKESFSKYYRTCLFEEVLKLNNIVYTKHSFKNIEDSNYSDLSSELVTKFKDLVKLGINLEDSFLYMISYDDGKENKKEFLFIPKGSLKYDSILSSNYILL